MRNSHYSPFLLLETPGFSELLWAPIPGPPLRLCPGDLTAPPDPQLAKAMTFACRHDIIKKPNFWWWWFEGGGSHEIFTNREGGSTIFLLLPGGDQKFNSLSFRFYHTPCELKNDNSLNNTYLSFVRYQLLMLTFTYHYGPSLEKSFPLLFHYQQKIFVLAWFFVKTSSTS